MEKKVKWEFPKEDDSPRALKMQACMLYLQHIDVDDIKHLLIRGIAEGYILIPKQTKLIPKQTKKIKQGYIVSIDEYHLWYQQSVIRIEIADVIYLMETYVYCRYPDREDEWKEIASQLKVKKDA